MSGFMYCGDVVVAVLPRHVEKKWAFTWLIFFMR